MGVAQPRHVHPRNSCKNELWPYKSAPHTQRVPTQVSSRKELEMDEVVIRPARHTDLNFVYASMLRGLYYGNTFFAQIDKKVFFPAYQAVLDRLLQKNNTCVVVACLASDPDCLLGFAVGEPTQRVLHYVFVKERWRRQGIAKKLLTDPKGFSTVTHVTKIGSSLVRKYGMEFNPFLL